MYTHQIGKGDNYDYSDCLKRCVEVFKFIEVQIELILLWT